VKRALLLVDHGSREAEAGAHLERIAGELRKHRPDLAVYTAHLELAEPSIATAISACARDGVEELIVHPFFLAPGRHASRDVPAALEAAARAHPRLRLRLLEITGQAAGLAELILGTLPPVVH